MSLACAPIRDLLSDHFDGRFPAGSPERDRIEAHLAACAPCSQILGDYARLRRALEPVPAAVADPSTFSRRLRARLAAPSRPAFPMWRPLAAAAALLLAFGVGWSLRSPAALPAPTGGPAKPPARAIPLQGVSAGPELPESPSWLGVTCRPLAAELASYLGLPAATPGVVVEHVVPLSPADRAGLRSGDVILSVDQVPIDIQTIRAAVREIPAGRRLGLEVLRPGLSRVTVGIQGALPPHSP